MNQAIHKNNSVEHINDDVYYFFDKKKWVLISLIAFFVYLLAFVINFSLKQKIENIIQHQVIASLPCPLTHDGIETSLFFPALTIKSPVFAASCFNGTRPISLDQLRIAMTLPSLIPPGIRFKLPLSEQQTSLNLYATLSLNGLHLISRDALIDAQLINQIMGAQYLHGEIILNIVSSFSYDSSLRSLSLSLDSHNLTIASQSIQGLLIPDLPLGSLDVKVSNQNGHLKIERAQVGDTQSPIRAQISGIIEAQFNHIQSSPLNLQGHFSLSEKFLDDFPLIQLLLQNKTKNAEGHPFRVQGTLGNPRAELN